MFPISAHELLPHKFPFQMVDELITATDDEVQTRFTIAVENVMVFNTIFTEGGLLENIAQSAAVGSGYLFASQRKEVPIGYIGAIKKVEIHRLPYVGDTIATEIITMHKLANASIVQGKIFLEKELIASAELTIFVQQ